MDQILDFLAQHFGTLHVQLSLAFLLICLLGLCIGILIDRSITAKQHKIVLENSAYYKSVLELNKRTVYHQEIARDGKVYHIMQVNSKAKFERTEEIASLFDYLSLYSAEMRNYLRMVSENRISYRRYQAEFQSLLSTITHEEAKALHVNYDIFCDIEQRLVDSVKLSMIQDLTITCAVEYTSPQGMRHYSKHCTYLESEIRTAMQHLVTREAYMQSEAWRRKNERAKVTPSLRYDVMKRDGFRCCLCGRSASNGIELEVDHIVPISKGGGTTYSNLQTLCRECNRGKGAKNS